MAPRSLPKFPFRVTWLDSGKVKSYDDPKDLLCNLEEFDSDDPSLSEATVTDALGRAVHLSVRPRHDQCEFRLRE